MSAFLGGGVLLYYVIGLCVIVVCTVRSPLKKVVVAWRECIPWMCCAMLRIYVGKYVIVVIVVYAVLYS